MNKLGNWSIAIDMKH